MLVVADLKNTVNDTHEKVTQHTIDENKTWANFDKKLTDVQSAVSEKGKITVDWLTIAKVLVPSLGGAATLVYYAKAILGR
jgi:hypothetical protein